MKLLALTERYGDRTQIRIDWQQAFFFRDEEPEPARLITLDLPRLEKADAASVARWLALQDKLGTAKALVTGKRRQIREFSRKHWRYAALDDFLDAQNYVSFTWQVANHFSVEEIVDFESRHMPEAWARAARELTVVPAGDLDARNAALARVEDFFVRTHSAGYGGTYAINLERQKNEIERDRQRVAAFDQTLPQPIDAWVALLTELRAANVQHELLSRFARRIIQETHDSDEILRILGRVRKNKKVRDATVFAHDFWNQLQPWVTLPPNVHGKTVDLTDAVEVVVPMGWGSIDAKRIGSLAPGRRALAIPAQRLGEPVTYIRAERKLKFEIIERGGSLQRHGCTLTVDRSGRSIRPLLLQVEELIVLANLAPQQALERLSDLDLPDDHPVYEAAERARDDYRYATIFADLLIELRTGLDADVARRLV